MLFWQFIYNKLPLTVLITDFIMASIYLLYGTTS